MVGYDLDEVLRTGWPMRPKPFFQQNKAERDAYDELCAEFCRTAECLFVPPSDEPYIIITGCHRKFRESTLGWLKRRGFCNFTIEFIDRSRTRQNMIDFKTEKIEEYGVTKFYEDDSAIVRALRKRCPNTEIVYVESDW